MRRYPQHRHSFTCGGLDGGTCRFHYPQQQSDTTRLRLNTDVGGRSSDVVLQRGPDDLCTVPHNPAILCRWAANMDVQLISSVYGAAQYLCSYLTKGEPEEMRATVREALDALPATAGTRQQLHRIGTTLLGSRECSLQEGMYLMAGLPLRGASRTVVPLNVGRADERTHIVDTRAYRQADDEDEVALAAGIYNYYAARPAALQATSLYEFATGFEVVSSRSSAFPEPLQVQGGTTRGPRYVRRRTNAAMLRTYPRMTPEAHGDDYYYAQLLLHVPWRDEEADLPAGHATAEAAFMQHADAIQRRLANQRYGEGVEATVQQLRELDNEQQRDLHERVHADDDAGMAARLAPTTTSWRWTRGWPASMCWLPSPAATPPRAAVVRSWRTWWPRTTWGPWLSSCRTQLHRPPGSARPACRPSSTRPCAQP